jgi:ABC-type phosphate transport system permease subunit
MTAGARERFGIPAILGHGGNRHGDKEIYFSAIVSVALILLLVAAVMNILARLLVWSVARGPRTG